MKTSQILTARAEAEDLVITVCMYCEAYLGEVPGEGTSGVSHGCCKECLPRLGSPVSAKREGAEEEAVERPRDAAADNAPSHFYERSDEPDVDATGNCYSDADPGL